MLTTGSSKDIREHEKDFITFSDVITGGVGKLKLLALGLIVNLEPGP